MDIKIKKIQSFVIAVFTLFIVFTYLSSAYAWYSIRTDSKNQGASIKVVNNYQMDVQWYDEAGKVIPNDTLEYVENYDGISTRYLSMENKGIASFYGMLSFDTIDFSYEFYLSRFTYTIYEIKTLDNLRMARVLKGSGIPSSELGVVSNYYVNTLNDNLYKKTVLGWGDPLTKTVITSVPTGSGTEGVIYLYESLEYYVIYQYIDSEWTVIAYDDLATPLDLYLNEEVSFGGEALVSSGNLADLANLLVGDLNNPDRGCFLEGKSGAGYKDGGAFFWKFEYSIVSSTIDSPNLGSSNKLYLKPRSHITFGEVYTIAPIEGPVWLVGEENLENALDKATDKHIIRLTENIETTENLTISKGLTLDLNGYDLTVGNLNYEAGTSYNSVFLNIPKNSTLKVVNLNINTSSSGRIYIDMGNGGKIEISNDFNIDAPNLSVALFGDTSVDQLKVEGEINVNVSYDQADEQRLSSSKGLSFYDLKTLKSNDPTTVYASIVLTKQTPGNESRIFISRNSVVGNITAIAAASPPEDPSVSKVQIVNLGTVGYIDLSKVVLAEDDYSIDVYFDGSSTAGANQLNLPSGANANNTYVEVSMNVDVLISSVSDISEYIRVFNNVVTEVDNLNKFSLIGSVTFTNDNISRPYYWVKFDTTNGKVLQVLKYGTIASFFADKGGTYDFEPVSNDYIYFDGWFEDGLEFVRNQAVTKDFTLTERMLTVDYLLKFELDAGVIDTYESKSDLVDDFLTDYTEFYNLHRNDDGGSRPALGANVDLKISGDVGYSVSTALVGRMDVYNCTPNAFFADDAIRNKWLWIIEYMMSNRSNSNMDNVYFEALLDKTLGSGEGHNIVKNEIWAFLASRKHSTWPATIDYSNFSTALDYIFFPSYPYRMASKAFGQGEEFDYTLPTPYKRGSYMVGGASYGYIFLGWYTNSDFSGSPITTINKAGLAALIGEGETIARLYAKWVPGVAKTTFTDKTEIYYNTIEESITSALSDPGSTVTLLMNTSLSSTKTIDQDITLDLGIYYLTINADFTISNGNIKGTKAYLLAGTNGSVLTIANAVPIEAGVRPWSVTGNPISEFVIGGERVLDIVYTASSGSWTTNKRQVIFMYWEDGNPNNDITSDLVLKVSSVLVVTSGSNIGAPGEPGAPSDLTKTGWEFMGWNKYSGGSLIASQGGYLYLGESITKAGSAFNFSTSITESTILVAWFKDSISYSIDGISPMEGDPDAIYYGELSTVRVEDTVKKAGYRLIGWEYTNGVTGEVFECGIPYTYQAYLPNDAMLIAKWMPIEYTVVFDSNGGSGLMDPAYQEFTYNVSQNLAANDFTKAGYAFVGWNTAANGSGEPYTNQVAIFEGNSITLNHGTTVVLYAQWQVATYAITFNINDDDGDGSGTMSNQSLTYGSVVALSANTYTRPGYSFKGWSMSSAGTFIDFYDKATLSDYNLLQLVSSGSTLYAVWGADLYIGYWTMGGVVVESGVYLFGASVTINISAPTGYEFNGWYGNSGLTGSKLSTSGSFTMSSDINYFGEIRAKTFTLTFNSNGTGSSVTPTSKTVTYDSAVGTLPTPTRTNSTFVEWNTSANGSGTKYTSATVYKTNNNRTLYAIWDFNITYNLDTGWSWTWTTGTVTPANGIDNASTLPEEFMNDFYFYLKENNLLSSTLVHSTLRKTNWRDFVSDGSDPKAWYNHTSTNLSGTTDGYSQFFWTSISGTTATGGFFGTEPYKSKYLNLLYHLTYMLPYKYSTADMNTEEGKALTGFVLDGYFYGTQSLIAGTFTTLRSTIPNVNLRWNSAGTSSSATTYPTAALTSYRDGTVGILARPCRLNYYVLGWDTSSGRNGTIITTIPAGEVPANTYYNRWIVALDVRIQIKDPNYSNPSISTLSKAQTPAYQVAIWDFEGNIISRLACTMTSGTPASLTVSTYGTITVIATSGTVQITTRYSGQSRFTTVTLVP